MTRLIQVANNATTTLASGITAIATSLTVAPGDGAKFPALSGSQYFKATLVKATGEIEVVKVTAKATDTFTIERANEVVAGASTAYAFSAGDKVECRWTGNSITDELDRLDAAALNSVANKTANYSVLAADISNLLRIDTTAGAIAVTLPQISTLTDDFAVLVSKVTSDGNAVTIARSSTNTINGATSYLLTSQWQSAWLIADRSTNTWTAINSSTGSISAVVDTFAGSGTAGPFTLSVDPGSVNNLAVFVGGVYQEKATLTLAGTSLTLGGTVSVGTNVQASYNTPVGIGVPGDGTVTTAKLADLSVTLGKLAAGFMLPRAQGGTGVAANAVVVDRAYAAYTANAALTATIPFDNTKPQITEGTEILSVSITPKAATSRVRLRFQGIGVLDAATQGFTVALFHNSTADAIASAMTVELANQQFPAVLEIEHVPGATTAQTYTIRVGAQTNQCRFNGSIGATLGGGASAATLIAEEISV